MSGNSSLDIFGEVRVDSPRGFGKHPRDALRDPAAHRLRGAHHGHRLGVPLNDDFDARFHLAQNRSDVFGQVAFIDVQGLQGLHVRKHRVSPPARVRS
jgi:hypothetical protein